MRVKFWAGIIVSAGLLVFLFSKIDYGRLWAVIRSADPFYVSLATVLGLAFMVVRAVRWKYLVEPVKPGVSFGALFSATMVGFMANNVLPARLGEFVRAYVLGRREDLSKSSVFATIIVERLFDTMSVLLILVFVLIYMPQDVSGGEVAGTIRKAGRLSFAAYLAMVAVLGLFIYRPGRVVSAVRKAVSPFSPGLAEKAAYLTDKFAMGLTVVKKPKLLLLIISYSALHWGLLYLPVLLLFKAFALPYGVYASFLFLVVTAFGVALPSTPGYIGTYEAAGAGALILLGLDKETALGFAILAHVIGFVPITLIGFICLYREKLSLGGIRGAEAGART